MKHFLFAFLISLLTFAGAVQAETKEIRGVDVPTTLQAGETELVLNGGERRRRWMMQLYIGALYLDEPTDDIEQILDMDTAKAVTMHITSGMINRDRLVGSIEDGFEAALDGDMAPVQEQVDMLIAAFDEEVEDGDLVELIYVPGDGVRIKHNGSEVGHVEGDETFTKALFNIWLGDNPAQEALKQGMLGR